MLQKVFERNRAQIKIVAGHTVHLNFSWSAARKHVIVDEPQIVTGISTFKCAGGIPDLLFR